jgi:hypothetical protein
MMRKHKFKLDENNNLKTIEIRYFLEHSPGISRIN